jgi:oxygen-independent coproporphyrinogen-3 oxidase
MQLDVIKDDAKTEIGSYFVSNYPPFSVWNADGVPKATAALNRSGNGTGEPLGLYLHIPFCRKRCRFCYFRVYTDKNSRDVESYMQALADEVALYADRPGLKDRDFEFVYFGGGTPSFLSAQQLESLIERISKHWRWDRAREVTFECEPGTLQEHKLETIKAIGVTRLSLGIEHFDDDVLELNGRAHKSKEVYRAYDWARNVGFDQVNVDLIAGMVGDREETWRYTVEETLKLQPDSLTIYQMELPHNTVISRGMKEQGSEAPVADWATKRAWVDYAFQRFEENGYVVSSAYTLVKPSDHSSFVYRDAVWHGADMVGTGVASFSHFGGVHYQNEDQWETYIERVSKGELPIARALEISKRQLLIRQLILQTKTGLLDAAYFRDTFHEEIFDVFSDAFSWVVDQGYGRIDGDEFRLTRAGLLRADAILPKFFETEFRDIRYT